MPPIALPLAALLLLAYVAMLGGARGPSGIAEWARNHGAPWRSRLGLTHRKGPSQSTVQRLFAHIAIDALEAQLAHWAPQVLVALSPPEATTLDGVAIEGKKLRPGAAGVLRTAARGTARGSSSRRRQEAVPSSLLTTEEGSTNIERIIRCNTNRSRRCPCA